MEKDNGTVCKRASTKSINGSISWIKYRCQTSRVYEKFTWTRHRCGLVAQLCWENVIYHWASLERGRQSQPVGKIGPVLGKDGWLREDGATKDLGGRGGGKDNLLPNDSNHLADFQRRRNPNNDPITPKQGDLGYLAGKKWAEHTRSKLESTCAFSHDGSSGIFQPRKSRSPARGMVLDMF